VKKNTLTLVGFQLRQAALRTMPPEVGDEQLLGRYLSHRDGAALELVMSRHARMVWGVCWRILRNQADAEDAFQATFLVLVRKAAAIVPRSQVGPWLYGVARTTALKAKEMNSKRRSRETGIARRPPSPSIASAELQAALEEAIETLPDKYRQAIVLCDLEGKTVKEAAGILHLPQGTLASRQRRARALLARRLTRQGLWPSAVMPPAAFLQYMDAAPLSQKLLLAAATAIRLVAAGQPVPQEIVSVKVVALSAGVMKMMLLTKLKSLPITLVAGLVLGCGATLAFGSRSMNEPPAGTAAPAERRQTSSAEAEAKFPTVPGWILQLEPIGATKLPIVFAFDSHADKGGASVLCQAEPDGALIAYLSYRQTGPTLECRPVAFDEHRHRYPFAIDTGCSHDDVALYRFRLDPKELPASKVCYLGVEGLSAQGRRVVAREAAVRAAKAGVELLPWPEVGQPMDFQLTGLDGKKIRSQDLHGKVVLVDCWSTTCAPCLAKMPKLKSLYTKYHEQGLEIVGVCFDLQADTARKTIARFQLTWPQVLAGPDRTAIEFWHTASGVNALPQLFAIDRSGKLRAQCTPRNFEEVVTKLVEESPKGDVRQKR